MDPDSKLGERLPVEVQSALLSQLLQLSLRPWLMVKRCNQLLSHIECLLGFSVPLILSPLLNLGELDVLPNRRLLSNSFNIEILSHLVELLGSCAFAGELWIVSPNYLDFLTDVLRVLFET